MTYLETRGNKYLAYETQCHGTQVLSQILMTNDPDFLENKKIKTNLLKKDSFIFSLFQFQVLGTILKMGKGYCFEILRKLLWNDLSWRWVVKRCSRSSLKGVLVLLYRLSKVILLSDYLWVSNIIWLRQNFHFLHRDQCDISLSKLNDWLSQYSIWNILNVGVECLIWQILILKRNRKRYDWVN